MAEEKERRILVVDDDKSVRELFELTLSQGGFAVDTASSGAEALEKLEKSSPALVLLDLMLPDYGGVEILEMMDQRGVAPKPAVIVITGRFADEATKSAVQAQSSVVAYLQKPVRPTELLAAVRRTLQTTNVP